MHSFKNFISEKLEPARGIKPKAGDEAAFMAKHTVDVMDYPGGDDDKDVTNQTKKSPAKKKRLADNDQESAEKVYEANDGECPHCDMEDGEHEENCPMMKEAMDPVGQEDDDVDNDGDSDESDEYLKKRRKTIKKAMKKEDEIDEMSDAQMKKREEIVKSMKDKTADFKKRYGDQWKSVMYATATKQAMKEEVDLDEAEGSTKYVVMQGPGDNNQKVIATFDGGSKALEKAKKFRDDWNKKNKSKIKLNKKGKPIAAHMARIFDKGVETSYKVGDKVSYSAFAPSIIKDEVDLDEADRAVAKRRYDDAQRKLAPLAKERRLAKAAGKVWKANDPKEREYYRLRSIIDESNESVDFDEAKMSASQIAALKKAYEPMRGKKISMDSANKLSSIMDKVGDDKQALIQLVKADIPFVSTSAVTRLISKHGMKGAEINKLKEEVEIDEAYKAGNLKLKDGSQVKLTSEDAKIINSLYKNLNASNRKQMEQRMMKDKKSFGEIVAFAKETM